MPKLWNATIEAHRREVHDAIMETAAGLVAKHGLHAVTMSQIAEETGIGRATLYKYFSDIEAILVARHARHVANHLRQLSEVRDHESDPRERLKGVLETLAVILHERAHQHSGTEIAALVHRKQHITQAEQHLRDFIEDLLKECAHDGIIRRDVAAGELASYCLSALTAASALSSKAAVRRLVAVTLAGLGTAE